MVISKCVPLAISRKKFSDFDKPNTPDEMIFVGYKTYQDEEGNSKTMNIKMGYGLIKEDIITAIKQDPEWGQGGGGNVPEDKPSEGVIPVNPKELITYNIAIASFDDEGNPVRIPISEGGTWDEENETNFIDVKQKQALIEINAGGNYVEDFVYIYDPVNGSVSHIVVDNTGLPMDDGTTLPAENEFTLFYGGIDNCYEILTVPTGCRGIVQVLHSKNMDMDFILHSSYSEVPNDGQDITRYVKDVQNESDEYNSEPVNMTPNVGSNADKFYIDMAEQKGFLEFPTGESNTYTFVFSTPELGSSTYLIIDNTGDNYHDYPVTIRYGKIIDKNENGIQDDNDLEVVYDITEVDNEICIIEIFHSLSADIIVKITKV